MQLTWATTLGMCTMRVGTRYVGLTASVARNGFSAASRQRKEQRTASDLSPPVES